MRRWILRLFGRKPDAEEKKRKAMDLHVRLKDGHQTSTNLAEKIREALERTPDPATQSSDTR